MYDTAGAREVCVGLDSDETMTEAPQKHDTEVAFVFFCFGPFGYGTAMTPLPSIVEQTAQNQWLLLRILP
jgi:hypothetical protein